MYSCNGLHGIFSFIYTIYPNPSCIDLILTIVKNSNTFEAGSSDHHKSILTVGKSGSLKEGREKKIMEAIDRLTMKHLKKLLSDKLSRLESNS